MSQVCVTVQSEVKNWFCLLPVHTCVAECAWNAFGASFLEYVLWVELKYVWGILFGVCTLGGVEIRLGHPFWSMYFGWSWNTFGASFLEYVLWVELKYVWASFLEYVLWVELKYVWGILFGVCTLGGVEIRLGHPFWSMYFGWNWNTFGASFLEYVLWVEIIYYILNEFYSNASSRGSITIITTSSSSSITISGLLLPIFIIIKARLIDCWQCIAFPSLVCEYRNWQWQW